MLICAIEEPIQPNGMLYATNEDETGLDFNLSLFEDSRLNRYSFVLLEFGLPRAANVFASLLRAIQEDLKITATWVLVRPFFPAWTDDSAMMESLNQEKEHWPKHARGPRTITAQKLLNREKWGTDEWRRLRNSWMSASTSIQTWLDEKRQDGWQTFHDDALAVARKTVDDFDSEQFGPPGYSIADGKLLLFLGNAPAPETLVRPPLRQTLQSFGHFAPSPSFLRWLAENDGTVVYSSADAMNHLGLVFVGTLRIDVHHLVQQGIVQDIDPDPQHVWRI